MATVGDIYQVVTRCTYLSKVLNNTFHFFTEQVGTTSPGAQQIANAVEDLWGNYIAPLLIAGCVLDQIYAINYHVPLDSYTLTTSLAGDQANAGTEGLPSFTAWSFRYQRLGGGQRYGYKRFGGLSENVVDGNNQTGLTTQLNSAAVALSNPIADLVDGTWIWSPFIAKRPLVLGTNPLGYIPVVCQYQGVTTQISRKA